MDYVHKVGEIVGIKLCKYDAQKFILHIRKLNNDKLNDIVGPYADTFTYYYTHPKAWRELTQKFIDRGFTYPYDWGHRNQKMQ